MTDYNGSVRNITTVKGPNAPTPTDSCALMAQDATFGGVAAHVPEGFGTSAIVYFKMRALRDPYDTGFVGWIVTTNPDPNGDQAPEAIVPGSAVIMGRWIG